MVNPSDLHIGLYVHLDLGWMDHPFPRGSFRISSQQQIDTIRSLGLKQVRVELDKSDAADAVTNPNEPPTPGASPSVTAPTVTPERQERRRLLNTQKQSLVQCERQFGAMMRGYKLALDELETAPQQAGQHCAALVSDMVGQMLQSGETSIRLLSEGVGDRASMHSINVTVLSLLLGQAVAMDNRKLEELGLAALLHDLGKARLPSQVRCREDHFTAPQLKLYQEHVAHSVTEGKRMGLSATVLLAMAQHHEMADGSGFPIGLKADKMVPAALVLSLVNRYENLCNPGNPVHALTPHEALSLMFSQQKARFEATTLNAFIRMMGVYPPGSVVQLTDQRYAMVVSVNSSRPLKPRVIVHDSRVPSDEALILDLEHSANLGVLRSLKPQQLPRQALEYLSPRKRVCYFFERAVGLDAAEEPQA